MNYININNKNASSSTIFHPREMKKMMKQSEGQAELTWNIDTACKSNGLVSGEAILPLRSLHLTSISLNGSKHISSSFIFITSKRDSGSLSAPLTRMFSKIECILVQSLQQSQFPSGNSCCWLHKYYFQRTKVGYCLN